MTINMEKNNDTVIMKLEGRLDTTTAPSLESAVGGLGADVKNLVIDMEKLEYISSAGLRVLLAAQKKMGKVGSLQVIHVCEMIMEVFDITGFTDILDIR